MLTKEELEWQRDFDRRKSVNDWVSYEKKLQRDQDMVARLESKIVEYEQLLSRLQKSKCEMQEFKTEFQERNQSERRYALTAQIQLCQSILKRECSSDELLRMLPTAELENLAANLRNELP